MKKFTHRNPTLGISAMALLSAGFSSGTAQGEILLNDYVDSDTFGYVVHQMPDFDQQRKNDLPNNGLCYCYPTSSTDLLAYISTHGYAWVDPGLPFIGTWESNFNYDAATATIAEIGLNTNTSSGAGGTPCGVSWGPIFSELNSRVSSQFVVELRARDLGNGTAPSLSSIAQRGNVNGAISNVAYGRYSGQFDNGVFEATNRHGGHAVTVNVATAANGNRFLGVRDPSSSLGTNSVQEPFETKMWETAQQTMAWNGGPLMTVERLGDPYMNNSRIRMIDAVISIYPKSGYTWGTYTPNSISRLEPFHDSFAPRLAPLPPLTPIERPQLLRPIPGDLQYAVLAEDKIRIYDLLQQPLPPLPPLPGSDPSPIEGFDVDRFGNFHVIHGRTLTIYDGRDFKTQQFELPGEASWIECAEPTEFAGAGSVPSTHMLIPEKDMIASVMYTRNGYEIVNHDVRGGLPMNAESRLLMMNDYAFIITNGQLMAFKGGGSGFDRMDAALPGFEIKDATLDADNVLLLIDADGFCSAWQMNGDLNRAEWHHFHGKQTPGRIAVTRSSNNALPWDTETEINLVDLEFDRDVPTFLDCNADLNFDRKVDSADIGLLLSAWGQSRTPADLNVDGKVDSADLGLMLGEYGPCP